MKINNKKSIKKLCLTAAVLLSSLNMQAVSAVVCNPGDHWVDSCTAGTENFNLSGAFGLNFTGLGFFDVVVDGSGVTSRSNPISNDPLDPGHFNQINTEILSAIMTTNNIPGAGVLTARFGTDTGLANPTLGLISETSDPAVANSYFDIFLEVDTPLGIFNSEGSVRFAANITEWLPGDSILYRLDAANSNLTILNSGGLAVATIDDLNGNAYLSMSAVPIPPSVFLFGSGLLGLIGVGRFKKTLKTS